MTVEPTPISKPNYWATFVVADPLETLAFESGGQKFEVQIHGVFDHHFSLMVRTRNQLLRTYCDPENPYIFRQHGPGGRAIKVTESDVEQVTTVIVALDQDKNGYTFEDIFGMFVYDIDNFVKIVTRVNELTAFGMPEESQKKASPEALPPAFPEDLPTTQKSSTRRTK